MRWHSTRPLGLAACAAFGTACSLANDASEPTTVQRVDPAGAVQPFLDDAEAGVTPPPPPDGYPLPVDTNPFPRVTNTGAYEAVAGMEVVELAKFHAVSGLAAPKFEELKSVDSSILRLRYASSRAYQEPKVSMPLEDTYAGHWLFFQGTKTTFPMNANMIKVPVENAHRIVLGQHVMIYDDATTFANAEHAFVTEVDVDHNVVTLESRGFRSTPIAHKAGSIIATHVNGAVIDPAFWAYNQSTACPRDEQGLQLNEVLATWLGKHLNHDLDPKDGHVVGKKYDAYDGILFDVTGYKVGGSVDVDNDLDGDGGLVQGQNLWGAGMDVFFANVRSELDARYPKASERKIVIGGTTDTRSFDLLNGDQIEGFPLADSFQDAIPDYSQVDHVLGTYTYFMHHAGFGPAYSEARNKVPTAWDPMGSMPKPTTNAPFRFSFGLALMEDGYYSKTAKGGDWWDEYAVRSTGVAVGPDEKDEVKRHHRGWLGMPLGPRRRIATFDPAANLVANGGFESDTSGWTAEDVTLKVAATGMEGTHAMKVSKMTSYAERVEDAWVESPEMTLEQGEYSLCFSAKAPALRGMTVSLGKAEQAVIVPDDWARRVLTFTVPAGKARIKFQVGREDSAMWLDAVYLFRGNANLFRRDFDHGTVVVNGSAQARTVTLEKGKYKRIIGFQDSDVNNGDDVDKVSIEPHDAAILTLR